MAWASGMPLSSWGCQAEDFFSRCKDSGLTESFAASVEWASLQATVIRSSGVGFSSSGGHGPSPIKLAQLSSAFDGSCLMSLRCRR